MEAAVVVHIRQRFYCCWFIAFCCSHCVWGFCVLSLFHCVVLELGDNCIQNFHLRRYIVGYTVGNLVLRQRVSGAVKRDFQTYIRLYTSPNENFEYGYPLSNALLQFRLNFELCKPRNTAHHPTKYDVFHDVKLFPAVYRRIYCRKFFDVTNQKSCYKSKCIRKIKNYPAEQV